MVVAARFRRPHHRIDHPFFGPSALGDRFASASSLVVCQRFLDPTKLSYTPQRGRRLADTERPHAHQRPHHGHASRPAGQTKR